MTLLFVTDDYKVPDGRLQWTGGSATLHHSLLEFLFTTRFQERNVSKMVLEISSSCVITERGTNTFLFSFSNRTGRSFCPSDCNPSRHLDQFFCLSRVGLRHYDVKVILDLHLHIRETYCRILQISSARL